MEKTEDNKSEERLLWLIHSCTYIDNSHYQGNGRFRETGYRAWSRNFYGPFQANFEEIGEVLKRIAKQDYGDARKIYSPEYLVNLEKVNLRIEIENKNLSYGGLSRPVEGKRAMVCAPLLKTHADKIFDFHDKGWFYNFYLLLRLNRPIDVRSRRIDKTTNLE